VAEKFCPLIIRSEITVQEENRFILKIMFKFFKKSTGTKDEVLVLAFRARYEAFQQLLHDNNAFLN